MQEGLPLNAVEVVNKAGVMVKVTTVLVVVIGKRKVMMVIE